jgi:ubiquitin carboxyl-terminal hydrolase 8
MNSALQCLVSVQPLTEYFLSGRHAKDINRNNPLGTKGNLADRYAELVRNMWEEDGRASISPNEFKKTVGAFAPRFKGFSQHDSQEFLAFLLDGLHEDLNRVIKKPYFEQKDDNLQHSDQTLATELWSQHLARNRSIVQEVFHGMFKSRVRCPHRECQHTSIVFDPFMYLSLPLSLSTTSSSSLKSVGTSSRSRGIGSEKSITLQQALENFTAEEELGEDNEWYCPKCKEQRRAYKKLDIWRLPEVLILHLKRFSQGKYRRSKLECMVDFPSKGLDMSPYVVDASPHRNDNNVYDLFAVSCHSGGLGGGHYTASVQQYTTGQWLDCNDARITHLGENPQSTLRASAYILMYRRRRNGNMSSNQQESGAGTGSAPPKKRRPRHGAML